MFFDIGITGIIHQSIKVSVWISQFCKIRIIFWMSETIEVVNFVLNRLKVKILFLFTYLWYGPDVFLHDVKDLVKADIGNEFLENSSK